MIRFVLHDPKDSAAVVVVEGAQAGMDPSGWMMDADRMVEVTAGQDIPSGHEVASKDMAVGVTVWKHAADMGKVVAPMRKGKHAHVHYLKTERW